MIIFNDTSADFVLIQLMNDWKWSHFWVNWRSRNCEPDTYFFLVFICQLLWSKFFEGCKPTHVFKKLNSGCRLTGRWYVLYEEKKWAEPVMSPLARKLMSRRKNSWKHDGGGTFLAPQARRRLATVLGGFFGKVPSLVEYYKVSTTALWSTPTAKKKAMRRKIRH
jgi:hypothetical protein